MLRVEMRVKGQIEGHWSSWFEGLEIDHRTPGETVLTGVIPDQSALYGLLSKARDLGLELASVQSEEIDESECS